MQFVIYLSFVIGIIAGCTSVGGVLLIPGIDALTDLSMRTIMSTVLVSFLLPCMFGAYLHLRMGNFTWRYVIPIALGGMVTCFAGVMVKEYVPLAVLKVVLGCIIVGAGVTALCPIKGGGVKRLDKSQRENDIILFSLGACIGLLSGMTGAGATVMSVPAMLILGYPPIFSIALGMPFQVFISLIGGVGNSLTGGLDWWLWLWLTIPMFVGTFIGVRAIRFFNPSSLRIVVSCLCIGTGAYMVIKEVLL